MTDRNAVAAVLERAADRIERPGAWCQGAPACDHNHQPINACDAMAVSWCAIGAIYREVGGTADRGEMPLAGEAKSALSDVIEVDIPDWNDAPGQTAANVAATMRKAAQAVREGRC